jgi:hypothetical protein
MRAARPAAAVMEHIGVGHQVEAPMPADQCQARPVAVDIEALHRAAETAAGFPAADRGEATPEEDRMAALLVTDTLTTK